MFAALDLASGDMFYRIRDRKRWVEFLDFLRQVRRRFPTGKLYVVLDNFSPHRKAQVRQWCAADDVELVFTSKSCWQSGVSRSTTSRSTGGYEPSRPTSSTPARPARHATGNRWFIDETNVKGRRPLDLLSRAVDQHGQVMDLLVSDRRDGAAARAFFACALTHGPSPVEVTTDRVPVYPGVIVPGARHVLEQYSNNRVESDHARLTARLRPMRGVKTIRPVRTIAAGHAFVQDLRRGHYQLTADVPAHDRVRVAFRDLTPCL